MMPKSDLGQFWFTRILVLNFVRRKSRITWFYLFQFQVWIIKKIEELSIYNKFLVILIVLFYFYFIERDNWYSTWNNKLIESLRTIACMKSINPIENKK